MVIDKSRETVNQMDIKKQPLVKQASSVLTILLVSFLALFVGLAKHVYAEEPSFEERLDFRLKKIPQRFEGEHNNVVFNPRTDQKNISIKKHSLPGNSYLSKISEVKHNIVLGAMRGNKQYLSHKYQANPSTPLYVYSVTKFVVGFLVAERVCAGDLAVTETIGKLSERLNNSAYKNAPLDSVLAMTSGVDEGANSAGVKNYRKIVYENVPVIDVLSETKTPDLEPYAAWEYSSRDSHVLAIVVQDSLGVSVAQLFEENIWNRINAEHYGYWETDSEGDVLGGFGLALAATDFLKVGRHIATRIANDGCLKGHYTAKGYMSDKNSHVAWTWHGWSSPENKSQLGGIGHDGQLLFVDITNGSVIFAYSNQLNHYDASISEVALKLLNATNNIEP